MAGKTKCDIEEVVKVTIPEILAAVEHGGIDGFFDMLSRKAGHEMLEDVDYKVESVNIEGQVLVKVTGCVEVEDEG